MTWSSHRILALACVASGIALAGAAHAQVHKCTGTDGKPVYQSEPCDGSRPAPSPQGAAPAAPDLTSVSRDMRKAMECASASKQIEDIIRYGSSNRTSQDSARIDAFRRNCQDLGFRYPDSASSSAHNKALYDQMAEEYMQQFQKGSGARAPAAKAEGTPVNLSKAGRCADLSRSIESAIREKATYSGEGAAMIVEFRSDCQPMGYKFPDTKANADYNRTRFHELLQESTRSRR